MSRSTPTKVTVVGAGSVGSSLAYACMVRGSADEVVLYDIDKDKVDAEVLDLAHGSQFARSRKVTGGADLALTADSDLVVITAGAKQHPGQTRLDLAATNAEILRTLMPALLEQSPHAVYILVTNPCDVLTVIAQRESGLPASRVFSSGTVLDSSRLRWRLAELSGVAVTSVHASIIGEHGDSEFPHWSQARIGPVALRDWLVDGKRFFDDTTLDRIADEVVHAAYTVIQGKGATNWAIGLSGARIVEAVLGDAKAILPVSSVLSGQEGIDGIALSLPSVVGRNGVEQVLDVPLDAYERGRLHASAEALATTLASL